MSRFFVGQRVRVARLITPYVAEDEATLGKEGVVNETACTDMFDRIAVGVTINGDAEWCFLPEELEPILPEGAAPSEFSYPELMDKLRSGVSA